MYIFLIKNQANKWRGMAKVFQIPALFFFRQTTRGESTVQNGFQHGGKRGGRLLYTSVLDRSILSHGHAKIAKTGIRPMA